MRLHHGLIAASLLSLAVASAQPVRAWDTMPWPNSARRSMPWNTLRAISGLSRWRADASVGGRNGRRGPFAGAAVMGSGGSMQSGTCGALLRPRSYGGQRLPSR